MIFHLVLKMCAQISFVLSQITRLTDGRTDRQKDNFLVARARCMQCMQLGKNDAENRSIASSFVWTKHRNVTDRQTDGQTARAISAVCISSNADALSKLMTQTLGTETITFMIGRCVAVW